MKIIDKMKKDIALRIAVVTGIVGTIAIIINNSQFSKENEIIQKLFYEYKIHYFLFLLLITLLSKPKKISEEEELSLNLIYDSVENPKLLLKLDGVEKNKNIKNAFEKIKIVKTFIAKES